VKPIVFFDIESTGVDPVKDRIISIHAIKVANVFDLSPVAELGYFINPTIPIPASATASHGITDDMVTLQPTFAQMAKVIHKFFCGCDLAGFNITNFDTLILWEEFYRAGIHWDMRDVNQFDSGTIFKRMEPRTLAAAVKFYCAREHTGAHDAKADVEATLSVFAAQLRRYAELDKMDETELGTFSMHEPRWDLAGKLTVDKEGEPVYTFGNSKGMRVRDNQGFARWMLDKDFPTQTKLKLKDYLENLERPTRGGAARAGATAQSLPGLG
jgi:DNA polymerase III subunit epsilon